MTLVSDIYKKSSGPEKPVIILISSMISEVREDLITEFVRETGIMGGLFHFVSKTDFNFDKFVLMIASIAQSIPVGHKFSNLLTALEGALDTASKRLLADVRKLKLGDYAFIQKLALCGDGQPLGDYVLRLFGDYLGGLLYCNPEVKKQREIIDAIVFERLPFHQLPPSLVLTNMYKNALFDPLDKKNVSFHPRNPETGEKYPYPHLGDLFICTKDNLKVFMVINAQCDLSYAPDNKVRPFDTQKSVLFIPGRLEAIGNLTDSRTKDKPRTELFEYEGKKYRIVWDTKHIRSCGYAYVKRFLNRNSLTPINRLRLPYALEVQRAFASDLTRVGTPVSPPLLREVKACLYCKGKDNSPELLLEFSGNQAIVFLTAKQEYFSLTIDLIVKLMDEMRKMGDGEKKMAERLTRQATAETGGKGEKLLTKAKRCSKKAEKIFNVLDNGYEDFLKIREPFVIEKPKLVFRDVLRITRNAALKPFNEYLSLDISDYVS